VTASGSRRARSGPATGPDAALKAELLSLTPDPDDLLSAACADFLASPAEAGDAGLVVIGWLRVARSQSGPS
jgi:hypothetical protein